MKKYIAIGFGVTILIVGALVVQGAEVPYATKGSPVTLDATCKNYLGNAIDSVFPAVPLTDVVSWYCARSFEDENTPNEWNCSGKYEKTLTAVAWVALMLSEHRMYNLLSIDGSNVTILKNGTVVQLNTAQKTAHVPFITNCLAASPSNMLDFHCGRSGSDIICAQNYLTTAANEEAFAQDFMDGKVLWLLEEE